MIKAAIGRIARKLRRATKTVEVDPYLDEELHGRRPEKSLEQRVRECGAETFHDPDAEITPKR